MTDANESLNQKPIWMSITSMVCGILAALAAVTYDITTTPIETYLGTFVIAGAAIVFAGIALAKKHRGKGFAIAGLVTGIIAALLCW